MGHPKKPHRSVIRLLLETFCSHKNSKVAILVVLLTSGLCISLNFLIPLLLKFIVDSLANGSFVSFYQQQKIVFNIVLYALCWYLTENITIFGKILVYKVVTDSIASYSSKFFLHLLRLPATFHSTTKTGAIIESIFRTQTAMDELYWEIIFYIYPIMAEIFLATIIIWYAYNTLFSLVFLAIVSAYIIFSYLSAQAITKDQTSWNNRRMEMASKATDSLSNWQTVYIFGNWALEGERISKGFDQQAQAQYKFYIKSYIILTIKEMFLGAGLLSVSLISGIGVFKGLLSIGDFTMINAYFFKLITPLRGFGETLKNIRFYINNISSTEEIFNIQNSSPLLGTLKASTSLSVEFKNIWFSYPVHGQVNEYELLHPKRCYALEDISFKLQPGQTLAIIGHSGSGKSTIAKLLCKLYNPSGGEIFINNQNINTLDEQSVRSSIAVVSQDFEMFEQTIRYNLLYSKPEATELELQKAIARAHLKSFIDKLPNGLDTPLGKKGVTISGGERQRIAIARALLRNPSIFIFDEPTSALDAISQQKINETIKAISLQTTTIIIAHKFSTIANADKIIILDEGRLVGAGSHTSLFENNEFYKKMFHFGQISG